MARKTSLRKRKLVIQRIRRLVTHRKMCWQSARKVSAGGELSLFLPQPIYKRYGCMENNQKGADINFYSFSSQKRQILLFPVCIWDVFDNHWPIDDNFLAERFC